MIRIIAKPDDESDKTRLLPFLGYMLGGAFGSILSIWVTTKLGIHG